MPDLPGIPKGAKPDPAEAARRAADVGKLIETGWLGLRAAWISDDAPSAQIEDMRGAFFAGAQHLFVSLTQMTEPGLEETEADMQRMSKVEAEIVAFYRDFERRRLERPTMLMAAAAAGAPRQITFCIDQIDRALRELGEAQGNRLSPADVATVLTFPLTRIATHGTEVEGRAMIATMRAGIDALEDAIAKKHPPKGDDHAAS